MNRISLIGLILIGVIWFNGQSTMQRLISHSEDLQLTFNKWDLLLQHVSHDSSTFLMLFPIVLAFISIRILRDWTPLNLVRAGSYVGWIKNTFMHFNTNLLIFFAAWILIGMLLTINTPFENNWSQTAYSVDHLYAFSSVVQLYTPFSPLVATVMQILYIYLFFNILYVLFVSIFVLSPKVSTLLSLSMFFLILGLVSVANWLSSSLIWIDLRVYSLLVFNYALYDRVWIPLFFMIVVVIGFLGTIFLIKRSKSHSTHVRVDSL